MLRRPVESALSPPIGVVYQGPIVARLARVQRLFERIQNEVRAHRRTDAPTDDATGKHVDHERHVQPTLPCRDIGEVRHPELIWALSLELPVDPVQRARGARIGIRRANSLAANCASQALQLHQPPDRAACDHNALPVHLLPDLRHTVDLHVGPPDTLDLGLQDLIAFGTSAAFGRITKLRSMASVARRGDPQYLADRLDPEGVAMLINEGLQDLNRRSSAYFGRT